MHRHCTREFLYPLLDLGVAWTYNGKQSDVVVKIDLAHRNDSAFRLPPCPNPGNHALPPIIPAEVINRQQPTINNYIQQFDPSNHHNKYVSTLALSHKTGFLGNTTWRLQSPISMPVPAKGSLEREGRDGTEVPEHWPPAQPTH